MACKRFFKLFMYNYTLKLITGQNIKSYLFIILFAYVNYFNFYVSRETFLKILDLLLEEIIFIIFIIIMIKYK